MEGTENSGASSYLKFAAAKCRATKAVGPPALSLCLTKACCPLAPNTQMEARDCITAVLSDLILRLLQLTHTPVLPARVLHAAWLYLLTGCRLVQQ